VAQSGKPINLEIARPGQSGQRIQKYSFPPHLEVPRKLRQSDRRNQRSDFSHTGLFSIQVRLVSLFADQAALA
jgi:hypothetical protein